MFGLFLVKRSVEKARNNDSTRSGILKGLFLRLRAVNRKIAAPDPTHALRACDTNSKVKNAIENKRKNQRFKATKSVVKRTKNRAETVPTKLGLPMVVNIN